MIEEENASPHKSTPDLDAVDRREGNHRLYVARCQEPCTPHRSLTDSDHIWHVVLER